MSCHLVTSLGLGYPYSLGLQVVEWWIAVAGRLNYHSERKKSSDFINHLLYSSLMTWQQEKIFPNMQEISDLALVLVGLVDIHTQLSCLSPPCSVHNDRDWFSKATQLTWGLISFQNSGSSSALSFMACPTSWSMTSFQITWLQHN